MFNIGDIEKSLISMMRGMSDIDDIEKCLISMILKNVEKYLKC